MTGSSNLGNGIMPLNRAIQAALSIPRINTYLNASSGTPALSKAITLYSWNAQVSAAFMYPLHLCEVVVRNAVSEALIATHGSQWPWDNGFLLSLPAPAGGQAFKPRNAVMAAAAKSQQSATPGCPPSTDKAVAEMSFAFWESMFTKRHDATLWASHLLKLFPNAEQSTPYFIVRSEIYKSLENLRKLRNRIAHHEPVFSRNLEADFSMIERLIRIRCAKTADWMLQTQEVQRLLSMKPF